MKLGRFSVVFAGGNVVAAYVGQQTAKAGDVTLTAITEQLRLAQAAKREEGGTQ